MGSTYSKTLCFSEVRDVSHTTKDNAICIESSLLWAQDKFSTERAFVVHFPSKTRAMKSGKAAVTLHFMSSVKMEKYWMHELSGMKVFSIFSRSTEFQDIWKWLNEFHHENPTEHLFICLHILRWKQTSIWPQYVVLHDFFRLVLVFVVWMID